MYLLGHVGFSILILSLFNRVRGEAPDRYRLEMIFGSMIPDLIDKPIGAIFFSKGRWFGHSVLVLTTLLVVGLAVTRILQGREGHFTRRSNSHAPSEEGGQQEHRADKQMTWSYEVVVLYAGSLLHLVEDFGIRTEVVLWPLLGSLEPIDVSGFLMGIHDPFTMTTELLGLLIITLLGWSERWERRWVFWTIIAILAYVLTYVTAYVVIVIFLQL